MRNAGWLFVYGGLFVAATSLGGGAGCSRRGLPGDSTGHIAGSAGAGGALGAGSAGALGTAGNGAAGIGGSGAGGKGGAGGPAAACSGPSDPRLVLADQRILPLTNTETLNTVRYLINDAEADSAGHGRDRRAAATASNRSADFPRWKRRYIDGTNFPSLDNVASHVGNYVTDNFATVTQCLNAERRVRDGRTSTSWRRRAYRRQLTADEQTRFHGALQPAAHVPRRQRLPGDVHDRGGDRVRRRCVAALAADALALGDRRRGDRPSTTPAGIPLTDASWRRSSRSS